MALTVELGVAGVGGIRLTSDAVWETVASLQVLTNPRHHAIHARLARLVPAHPRSDLDFLLGMLGHGGWFPDLLSPVPLMDPPHPVEQFERLRETPADVVEHDLAMLRELAPGVVEGFAPEQLADRVATELTRYWHDVLEPLWDEVDAIAADDIAFHSRRMSREGVASALGGVHDDITYADGRLRVGVHACVEEVPVVPEVWFVPSAFRWPWIAVRHDGPVVVSYAARGAARVWEPSSTSAADDALSALLGRSRAAILQRLVLPRSTTWLAKDLGLSPGTVSDHLSVMVSSGLLTSRREGRRVLYTQTPLGGDLAAGGPRAWSAVP